MRKRSWKEYNQNLVNRGSLTFFIDKEALKPLCQKKKSRGRPKCFADPLIQLLLILKIQYKLIYRSLRRFWKIDPPPTSMRSVKGKGKSQMR